MERERVVVAVEGGWKGLTTSEKNGKSRGTRGKEVKAFDKGVESPCPRLVATADGAVMTREDRAYDAKCDPESLRHRW